MLFFMLHLMAKICVVRKRKTIIGTYILGPIHVLVEEWPTEYGDNLGQIFVVQKFPETRSGATQTGHVVGNLLDSINLLFQKFIQKLGHVVVTLFTSKHMQVDDRLINLLLEIQSAFHCVQTGSPFVLFWLLDVLQKDASSTLVLKLHELLSVLILLVCCFLEIIVESRQCDVIPGKVERHRVVDVAGVQLHVDLLVDTGLAFGGVILATDRSRHFLRPSGSALGIDEMR